MELTIDPICYSTVPSDHSSQRSEKAQVPLRRDGTCEIVKP